MFEKSFVINLPFKTDRLAVFKANYPASLPPVETWRAIHGDTVIHPFWWTAGRGAWGCYRSHLQILEHCYNTGVESYVVFEDDAIFRQGFDDQLVSFINKLPDDWEQVYLGGQLLHEIQHPPKKLNDDVYIPFNVNRTHCFAVHRRGYEKLYQHLNNVPFQNGEHIDHHLGRLHESGRLKTYCPAKWLVGQDGGPSNISGNLNAATFWADPERLANAKKSWEARQTPAVYLEAPIEVAIELERRRWHRGNWQNEQRLDRGIVNAIESPNMIEGIHNWYKAVVPEAVREGKTCVCLYHPAFTVEFAQSLDFAKFHPIIATTADEAEAQFNAKFNKPRETITTDVKRNLIYHIWPKAKTAVWRWNVHQLLERIDQFGGVRSIGVVLSEDSATLDEVKEAFGATRIDNWIVDQNDPQLGEVVTFPKLLATLPQDDSITFYGHAKGVSYDDPNKTRDWSKMLYEVCLDDPAYVAASLDQFPVSGPFVRAIPWDGGPKNEWFFSGSFFWFRNSDVFTKRDWSKINPDRWGVECWPGSQFERSEAGELFGQEIGHLYDLTALQHAQGWLKEWKSRGRNAPKLPTISVVIPTLGRSTLKAMVDSILPQLGEGDEIHLVADGDDAYQRTKFMALAQDICQHSNPDSVYGHAQRNYGIQRSKTDLIWFCDDDDTIAPDAIATIKREMSADPTTPMMFRQNHKGHVLWYEKSIHAGNTGAVQLVVPNAKDLPRWPVPCENNHECDNIWLNAVNDWRPVKWSESVIYNCERSGFGQLAV
jgi:Glycosyl transferase family 2/Glycosyltransferase family 25 (LPS biosynthesis protein)